MLANRKFIKSEEKILETKGKPFGPLHRLGTKVLAKLSISHMQRQKVRYSFDRWVKRHNGKIRQTSFQIQISNVPYSLQMRGWWCGSDRARVTSRLFSGPCKQSRPMTCSIMPFEEEASSVMMKKNQGVPLLTIGSSSRLQRGKQG